MNRHCGASALPPELLSLIFDHLPLAALLIASHVSKSWRTNARDHPIFWRHVVLSAASCSALDFFHARLEAGSPRSVCLLLAISSDAFSPNIRSTLLRTLRSILHRLEELHIDIPVCAAEEVYSSLHAPAPRIHSLTIASVDAIPTSNSLPSDLFACQAPGLRLVQLVNTPLRADEIPQVFSSINRLICFTKQLSLPTALFAHCPALETLRIYADSCSLDPDDGEELILPAEKLRVLDIPVPGGVPHIMSRLPCTTIPKIAISLADSQSAEFLLSHLRGRLDVHLELEPSGHMLSLHYRSVETGMLRTIRCPPAQIALAYLPPVFTADDVMSRVETLHVTSACVALLPAFSELATCKCIEFQIVDGAPLAPPPRTLSAPKLESVHFWSTTPQCLDGDSLMCVLGAALQQAYHKLRVTLKGVMVDFSDESGVYEGDHFFVTADPPDEL